jgi:hypothetical protein
MKVRARPAGWNEELTDEQIWDLDPYEGPTDYIEGELVVRRTPWGLNYFVDGRCVDPKTVEEIAPTFAEEDWEAYVGPRGGKGFRHKRTGKIVYCGHVPQPRRRPRKAAAPAKPARRKAKR